MTPSGIQKLCERFNFTGSINNQPGNERKSATTPQTDRRIVRTALRDRRRLLANGLRARVPRKKPYLNAKQRQKRLQWATEHLDWKLEDWEKIIWSDETRISIFGSDGIKYV